MKKLIIIRGNSGSGKTTLAKCLHNQYKDDSLLIDQDTIRREMLNGDDDKASDLLLDLIAFGKNNYNITILEGIFVSRKYKKLFEGIKEIYKQNEIHAYYYDLSFEETIKRHQTRNNRFEFGEDKMRSWFVEKDYLNNFNETLFDETVSIQDALDIINK